MIRRAGATVLALALMLAAPGVAASEAVPVVVYKATGEASNMAALREAMGQAEVVFIGEEHDDAVAHRLELELLRAAKGRQRVLALEMFERDTQLVIDEYLTGLIREKDFLAASRPWGNYEAAYRPLVEHARAEEVPVVASNAPTRYVSLVGRSGPGALYALPQEARYFIAPLPLPQASEAYARKFAERMGGHGRQGPASDMLAAQMLRDATMAHAIARHLEKQPKALVLHVNGRFHSDGRLGTPEVLAQLRPATRMVVVTLETKETGAYKPEGQADARDFVIRRAAPAGTPPAASPGPIAPSARP